MKTLYFDINGTIVHEYKCKPALVNGRFEEAILQAGFRRLVCMSNALSIVQLSEEMGQDPDYLDAIFDLCWGAFRDRAWFREVTTLVSHPECRVRFIDFAGDWWYLDDLAKEYLDREKSSNLFDEHYGKRILAPEPTSDGTEILRWLRDCQHS
jgi:hypothetical protein